MSQPANDDFSQHLSDGEESNHEDASDTDGAFLEYIENELWKVIQNGNSKKRISTGKDGVVRKHLRRFHGMDDAKEIWEAIRTRFGGNANSKKMQKAVFKQQFEAFKISNSEGLEKGYDSTGPIWAKSIRTNPELTIYLLMFCTITLEYLSKNFRCSKIIFKCLKMLFCPQSKSRTNKVKSGFSGRIQFLHYFYFFNNILKNEEDSIGKPSYSRFTKTNDFKGVPHPLSGDYTPKPQEEIDDSLYVYGKKGPQKPEISVSDENSSEHSTCQSNDSEGSCENTSEHSFETESESKMAREAEVKRVVNTGNGVTKPVWTNANRINHSNNFVPRSVQLNTCRPKFNSVRPNINTGRTNISFGRPKVNTVSPKVNTVRPRQPAPHTTSNSKQVPTRRILKNSMEDLLPLEVAKATYLEKVTRHPQTCTVLTCSTLSAKVLPVCIAKDICMNLNCGIERLDMLEFCGNKGIKQEYSNARTPQQNGVAERMNRTLIEAARTMLADSLLPTTFWAEAVSTACYIFNRVRVTKPQHKTPYELLFGHKPIISYIRPFGCHVTILDTLSVLGKFDRKSDEGFLVGYSLNSKAYRVYNLVTKRVEVNLHVNFLEEKPNVKGVGYRWMFDIDYLTDSMNYIPVSLENQANNAGISEETNSAGTSQTPESIASEEKDEEVELIVVPSAVKISEEKDESRTTSKNSKPEETLTEPQKEMKDSSTNPKIQAFRRELEEIALKHLGKVPENNTTSTPSVNTGSQTVNTGRLDHDDSLMPELEIFHKPETGIFDEASYDEEGVITDFNSLPTEIEVSPTPTLRIHSIHPKSQILGDPKSAVQTRSRVQNKSGAHALLSHT
ncbi:ribonuclease H-like domain-containing protein [Tanacetum coccineum]